MNGNTPVATQEGPAPQHLVTDMAQVKTIVDPVRMTLLEMLAEKELTSRELAKELNISQQLCYHHLQKLIEAGLVRITRTGKRGNLEVYFYQAIAKTFEFALPPINAAAIHAEIDRHVLEDRVLEDRDVETAEVLQRMGFDLSSMPAFADWAKREADVFVGSYKRLMDRVKHDSISQTHWESAVAALRIGTLASLTDAELDAWFATVREVRNVLKAPDAA